MSKTKSKPEDLPQQQAGGDCNPRLVLGSSECSGPTHYAGCTCHEKGWENKWKCAVEMAARAEARLDAVHQLSVSALQTSWLYAGKEHVEKLMREIAAISSENVKEHAPLSARASVDHGVDVEIADNHVNKAADRGCCVSSCSLLSFIAVHCI